MWQVTQVLVTPIVEIAQALWEMKWKTRIDEKFQGEFIPLVLLYVFT